MVDDWLSLYPYMNLGVATGSISGFFVVDIEAAGLTQLAAWEKKHGRLPNSPQAKTGGGGRHLYYALPAHTKIKKSVKLISDNVDICGEGAYVVVPPSTSGKGPYTWCEGLAPWQTPLLEAPAWILSLISATSGNAAGSRMNPQSNDYAEFRRGFPDGERQTRLWSFAGLLREDNIPYEEALLYMREAAANSTPSWTEADSPETVEQMLTRCYLTYTPSGRYRKSIARPTYNQHSPQWEEPVPLSLPDPIPFPVDIFPGWLGEYVDAVSTDVQAPIDIAGMLALSELAACTAKRARIMSHKHTWTEPLNLWVVVTAISGDGKSPIFKRMNAPLLEYDHAEKQRMHPEVATARATEKRCRKRMEKIIKDSSGGLKSQDDFFTQQIQALQVEIDAAAEIQDPMIFADDFTPERLNSLMKENAGRIAVMSAEADLFSKMAKGRYGAADPRVTIYNSAFDGDELRVQRVKEEGRCTVEDPALTMGVLTQPETFQQLGVNPEFRSSGFIGRWFFSFPKPFGIRNHQAPPIPAHVQRRYDENMLRLANMPYADPVLKTPHILRFAPGVGDLFCELGQWIEENRQPGQQYAEMREWASKLFGRVLRVIGLLHLAYHATEPDPWRIPVSEETFDYGSSLIPYLSQHAMMAYETLKFGVERPPAMAILSYLREHRFTNITRTQIATVTRLSNKNLQTVLGLLMDYGYLRYDMNTKGSFLVNPLFLRQEENP
jgi:hypothetical protein